MAENQQDHESALTAEEFHARRRGRNYAVFGGVIFLCVIFFIITILRVGYGQ